MLRVGVLGRAQAREETNIVAVTHNDFLEALLRDSPVTMADPSLRTLKFSTADSHSFYVALDGAPAPASA
jgi:hypothetical protein